MQITAEEKLMYGAMKAIYDSGIPVDFKGAMVLKACLIEAGYNEEIRHTVDIDANWYSDSSPTAEQMTDSLQKALKRGGIDLDVSLYRMHGEGRSAGFELSERETGEVLFTMDIDVNHPAVQTRIYEISDIRFRPLTWVSEQKDELRAYLLKNETADFNFRGKDYHVEFARAEVFPQGFFPVADRLGDFY